MKKRVVTVTLWFYVAWYAAALVAFTFGLPAAIGPIFGAIVAAVLALRLRHPRSAKLDPAKSAGGSAEAH